MVVLFLLSFFWWSYCHYCHFFDDGLWRAQQAVLHSVKFVQYMVPACKGACSGRCIEHKLILYKSRFWDLWDYWIMHMWYIFIYTNQMYFYTRCTSLTCTLLMHATDWFGIAQDVQWHAEILQFELWISQHFGMLCMPSILPPAFHSCLCPYTLPLKLQFRTWLEWFTF